MNISTIVAGDETLGLNAFKNYSIWHKDVQLLSPHHLLACYTQVKRDLGIARATELMLELKGECIIRFLLGDITSCPVLDWRPPVEDLVSPALLSFMRSLSFNARACILVALSESQSATNMATLTWDEVALTPWTEFSRKVIARVPPRLGCRFVFWEENTIGSPAALLSLEDEIRDAMHVSWKEFATVASRLLRFEHFAHPEIESLIGIAKH